MHGETLKFVYQQFYGISFKHRLKQPGRRQAVLTTSCRRPDCFYRCVTEIQ